MIGDARGRLIALERSSGIPFEIARVYFIYGTEPGVARGFHAHRALRQWAVCVAGSCTLVLDDGHKTVRINLNRPDEAVEIAPMVWHEMHDFTSDCVLAVLASAPYDEADYLRNYDEFVAEVTLGQL